MNINIGIHIHNSGKAKKIKREAYISEDDAYAVTTIEIGGLIIDLFHGVDEDPLNTRAKETIAKAKGEDNE